MSVPSFYMIAHVGAARAGKSNARRAYDSYDEACAAATSLAATSGADYAVLKSVHIATPRDADQAALNL